MRYKKVIYVVPLHKLLSLFLFRTEDTGSYYCLVNNKENSQDKIKLKVLGRYISY